MFLMRCYKIKGSEHFSSPGAAIEGIDFYAC